MKSDVCISTYLRTHSAAPYVFDSRRPDASQRRHDGISGLRTELNRKKDAARVAEARLMTFFSKLRSVDLPRLKTVTASEQSWSDRRIQVTLRADAFGLEQIDNQGVVVQLYPYKNI
ncbi:hypothetical protein B9Z55_028165 [Caenorhabditis nigoni]|nr:hypothetical protein B9Z55_028165 [Caenorhabditis nigoni]